MSATKRPNYLVKLERLLAAGQISLKPGGVHIVDVVHDDRCAIHYGQPCDCDPDVKVRPYEAQNR